MPLLSSSIFTKSHEKGLIIKERLVTDTHINFAFKLALHFSTLIIQHSIGIDMKS